MKRNESMYQSPIFKKHDRYKASSYQAYNWKMPSHYDSSFWMKIFQVALWDRAVISEILPDIVSVRILDVGCATGRLLCSLAKAGAIHLSGVDLAPRIIEVARQKLSNLNIEVDLKTADCEDTLPWPDNFFDIITITGVIHHFFRPADALKEVSRVLRINGRVIILEPWFFPPLRQIINLFRLIAPHDGDYRFYSPKKVVKLISDLGWNNSRYRSIGGFSFLVTATKPKNICNN